MEIKCDEIVRNCTLDVELDVSSEPGRAYVRFVNKTRNALWFPAQQEPAFRPDEKGRTLRIWFGYFDEVYGKYKGRYMLPPLKLVPAGSDFSVELTAPALVQKLVERRLSPHIQARVATSELPQSRTRGKQPLDEYINYSCVIELVPPPRAK